MKKYACQYDAYRTGSSRCNMLNKRKASSTFRNVIQVLSRPFEKKKKYLGDTTMYFSEAKFGPVQHFSADCYQADINRHWRNALLTKLACPRYSFCSPPEQFCIEYFTHAP